MTVRVIREDLRQVLPITSLIIDPGKGWNRLLLNLMGEPAVPRFQVLDGTSNRVLAAVIASVEDLKEFRDNLDEYIEQLESS